MVGFSQKIRTPEEFVREDPRAGIDSEHGLKRPASVAGCEPRTTFTGARAEHATTVYKVLSAGSPISLAKTSNPLRPQRATISSIARV
ncbi:MAG TPA: hypothetical protein VLH38_00715 [Patescibacteria group bacterium]|nr:hypothetical protein [Patescibacteria group bacterium]